MTHPSDAFVAVKSVALCVGQLVGRRSVAQTFGLLLGGRSKLWSSTGARGSDSHKGRWRLQHGKVCGKAVRFGFRLGAPNIGLSIQVRAGSANSREDPGRERTPQGPPPRPALRGTASCEPFGGPPQKRAPGAPKTQPSLASEKTCGSDAIVSIGRWVGRRVGRSLYRWLRAEGSPLGALSTCGGDDERGPDKGPQRQERGVRRRMSGAGFRPR